MTERARRWTSWLAALALAGYSALLAVALFSPTSTTQSGLVVHVQQALLSLDGSPDVFTFSRLEVLMNAAIFVPLAFLGSFVFRRLRWQDWIAYTFIGAIVVELVQGVLLSHRQMSFSDIVANTAGALAGAVLARPFKAEGEAFPPKTR